MPGPVSTDDWALLTATCDGTTTKLFFNGSQVSSFAAANNVFGFSKQLNGKSQFS